MCVWEHWKYIKVIEFLLYVLNKRFVWLRFFVVLVVAFLGYVDFGTVLIWL